MSNKKVVGKLIKIWSYFQPDLILTGIITDQRYGCFDWQAFGFDERGTVTWPRLYRMDLVFEDDVMIDMSDDVFAYEYKK